MRRCGAGLALALLACGGNTSKSVDAGGDGGDASAVDAATSGVFTVTATLTLTVAPANVEALATFPITHTFTLAVDESASRMVMGARGYASAHELATTDRRTYVPSLDLLDEAHVPIPSPDACDPEPAAHYFAMTFSIEGDRLVGTGEGEIGWAGTRSTSFTATLEGHLDTEPPTLLVPKGPLDPMGEARFVASEPLRESGASLIGDVGDVFVLGAQPQDGLPDVTTSFIRSPLMLNWGSTYEITTEALTDLAGNVGDKAPRPSIMTLPEPPLAAEDGFESVTTATFGGAQVLTAGPLAPLAGAKSLMLPANGSFAVRLPIQPGDSHVRGTVRFTSPLPATVAVGGEMRAGVPGREVSVVQLPSSVPIDVTIGTGEGTISFSAIQTIEVPIPAGATDEVSFEIVMRRGPCPGPPSSASLLLDDLRVE
jgi:hypothetical protein